MGEQAGQTSATRRTTAYQQATEKVSQIVDRGREAYDRARSGGSGMGNTGTTGTANLLVTRVPNQTGSMSGVGTAAAIPATAAEGARRTDGATFTRRTGGRARDAEVAPSHRESTRMTQTSAEKIANVVIGAAAVGAAYYVLKTPAPAPASPGS